MSSEPKPLIIIIEDEKVLASMVAEQVELSGMMSQEFYRCDPALRFLKEHHANLVLLDVTLPDMSGFDFLEQLRSLDINVPVIFLTANDSEVDKVKGFNMGGDDYIVKPFSFPILIARIQAVLRRTACLNDEKITRNTSVHDEPFDFCNALIHPQHMEICFEDGASEKIGKKELGILSHFARNADTVLTRQSLIHSVWGVHADIKSRSLDQYIVKIRNHYNRHGADLSALRTVHGVGYIYESSK